MDGPGLHARYVGFSRRRAELAVDAVARRQDDLLALVDADDRRDARVKPVLSRGGLSLQALAAVDLDPVHRRLLIVRVPVTSPVQYTLLARGRIPQPCRTSYARRRHTLPPLHRR